MNRCLPFSLTLAIPLRAANKPRAEETGLLSMTRIPPATTWNERRP